MAWVDGPGENEAVVELLAALPQDLKDAVTLVYLEGLNHREAASCLLRRDHGLVAAVSCQGPPAPPGPHHRSAQMNRDPFESLRNTPVPTPSDAAKEKALHRATLAFRSRPRRRRRSPQFPGGASFRRWVFRWGVFLVLFWLLPFDRQGDLSVQRRLLQEMSHIFPESLNAVIESRGGTQVDLTAGGNETRDQPLLIEFLQERPHVRAC